MTSSSFTDGSHGGFAEKRLTGSVVFLEPWGEVAYENALRRQADLTAAGHVGWLLFSPPPTLTLGLRASDEDILLAPGERQRAGFCVVRTDRGGQVTYHGPSQCVGFPLGRLKDFTGDPRGVRVFLRRLQEDLIRFLNVEFEFAGTGPDLLECSDDGAQAGVWVRGAGPQAARRKIVALGMKFMRDGIGHGFALNLWPDEGFSVINPCGQPGAQTASLWRRQCGQAEVLNFLHRLALALPLPPPLK